MRAVHWGAILKSYVHDYVAQYDNIVGILAGAAWFWLATTILCCLCLQRLA